MAFVMVLYSTFLTRSGVLGDTSVHSFVDPGKFAFWILLAFMLTFISIGVGLVASRRKDMNINREDFAPKTREFMLSIGAALVMASAIFVTIGTSWPVILEVIGQPKIAVPIKYYDNIHLVLMPLVLVVNGLSLLMQWRNTSAATFRKNLSVAAIAAGVLTLATVVVATLEWPSLVLAATAWFSLIVNVQTGWSIMRKGASMAGAYISHTGIALLVFGVVTTSQYAETHHAVLVEGVPTEVAGYELTFLGKEQIEKHFADREKFQYHVNIKGHGEDRTVSAVLYWSDYNRRQSAFLEPGIRWGVVNDLYISPKATEDEDVWHSTTMLKEATIEDPITTGASITFNRFLNPMELGESPDGRMQLGADLTIRSASGTIVDTQAVTRLVTGGPNGPQYDPIWTELPGTTTAIALTKVSRNNDDLSKSTASFSFRDTSKPLPTPREIFTIDFSVKPLISLVWIGVITMVLGFTFSIVRYSRLLKAGPTGKQTSE